MNALPLKLFGAALLSLSGLLGGCYFSRRLAVRRKFLADFGVFISNLETAIRYRSAGIFTLVNSSQELFEISETNLPFETAWELGTSDFSKRFCLSSQDCALLKEFGSQLGKTDAEGQIMHLEMYQTLFSEQRACAEEDIKNKSKQYKTMGLFVGVSTALMMI